jgi:hypothetical protein
MSHKLQASACILETETLITMGDGDKKSRDESERELI